MSLNEKTGNPSDKENPNNIEEKGSENTRPFSGTAWDTLDKHSILHYSASEFDDGTGGSGASLLSPRREVDRDNELGDPFEKGDWTGSFQC